MCFAAEGTCPICFDMIQGDAIETICCGKLLCTGCSEKCGQRATCFNCRAPVATTAGEFELSGFFGFQKNHFATRMLQQEEVKCTWCGHRGTLQKMSCSGHISEKHYRFCQAPCPKMIRKCPHAGCEYEGELSAMKQHLACDCEKGYRQLDQEALDMCGGIESLERQVKQIHTLLVIWKRQDRNQQNRNNL